MSLCVLGCVLLLMLLLLLLKIEVVCGGSKQNTSVLFVYVLYIYGELYFVLQLSMSFWIL